MQRTASALTMIVVAVAMLVSGTAVGQAVVLEGQHDGFEDGSYEDTWWAERDDPCVEASVQGDVVAEGDQALEIRTDTCRPGHLSLVENLTTPVLAPVEFSAMARVANTGWAADCTNHGFTLQDDEGQAMATISRSAFGHIKYATDQADGGTLVPDGPARPGTWYNYSMVLDPVNSTVDFRVEDQDTGETFDVVDVPATVTNVTRVRLSDADYCTGTTSYFDAVSVEAYGEPSVRLSPIP